MRKLLPLILLLTACEAKLDTDKLDTVIEQQLRSGPVLSAAFLTLKYGDSRPVVARKLDQLSAAGTVTATRDDSEGEYPLPSAAIGFHLTTPYELKDLNWDVSTNYHNDSLTQVSLFAFVSGDPQLAYQALLNKYSEVYGVPATSTATEAIFINGSQRVGLTRSDNSLGVTYQNTALDRRISRTLSKSHFDAHGNSYDSTYYQRVILPRKVVNPDKI